MQIESTFFLVVRFVLNSICMEFGVNRSMFTGGTSHLTVLPHARLTHGKLYFPNGHILG